MASEWGNNLGRLRIVQIIKEFTCGLKEWDQGSRDTLQGARTDLSGIRMTEFANGLCV